MNSLLSTLISYQHQIVYYLICISHHIHPSLLNPISHSNNRISLISIYYSSIIFIQILVPLALFHHSFHPSFHIYILVIHYAYSLIIRDAIYSLLLSPSLN
jgi:hypothetical protein